MKEIRNIKKLQTQVRKIEVEIFDIHAVMAELQRTHNQKKREKLELINKIEEMKKGELKVTEHAILRYFERVLNFNLEEIEEKILSCVPEYQKELGSGIFPCNGFKVVVKENTVITLMIE